MDIPYRIGEVLDLPDLAGNLALTESKFIIEGIIPGGMGFCLKIRNAKDNSLYAVKMIYAHLFIDNEASERYLFEIRVWLTISSCNGVVEALCISKINDIPCIVSKWMNNGNLNNVFNCKEKPLFLNNIHRIISTLKVIYNKYNLIHRDLKPNNILLDNNFNSYIADWGIAKALHKGTSTNNLIELSDKLSKYEQDTFLGTIYYASPEQIKGVNFIDCRSDIYSLGCIMYEWETGTPPFTGKSRSEIISKQLYEKPASFSSMFNKSNFGFEKIILKCLEKDPDNRYQKYEEISYDIERIENKQQIKYFNKIEIINIYPTLGNEEFDKDKNIKKLKSKDGKYAIIKHDDIEKYLDESVKLINLGEYQKAQNILKRFFVSDVFKNCPDDPFVQFVCVNLAETEAAIGNINKAIEILRTLDFATLKPVEYYINLSHYLNRDKVFDIAEYFCKEGIKQYPNDHDLLGNLTIALSYQNKFDEALNSSSKRLEISRNVHSLEEHSMILIQIADRIKNVDFPNAINNYRKAYAFLTEAKTLNPKFLSTRYELANVLFKLRKYPESTKELVEISNVNENRRWIEVYYMARNFLWVGSFQEGIDFINKYIDKIPEEDYWMTEIKRIRSEIYIDGLSIQNDKGKRFIEKESELFFMNIVKNIEKRKPSDFKFFALIKEWRGEYEEEETILNNGINIYNDYWQFNYILSYTYLHLSNREEAINKALEQAHIALEKAPWRESVYFRLSELYKYKNDKENSWKYHNKGMEIKEIKTKLYNEVFE